MTTYSPYPVRLNPSPLLWIFVLAAIMLGCKKDDQPTLNLTTKTIEVQGGRTTATIGIVASGTWSIEADQPWIHFSKTSGTGNSTVSFDVDLNPVPIGRTANLTIKANNVANAQMAVVNQLPGDAIVKVSRLQTVFSAPESLLDTVRVVSNTSWTVSGNPSWLTVTPVNGTGNTTLTLTAQKNTGLTKRQAKLTIAASGSTVSASINTLQNPRVVVVAGGNFNGSNLNQLFAPSSVFMDSQGNLFIADGFNNRVVKWTPNSKQGIVVAGGNGVGNNPDQLYGPHGVAVNNANGDLYVSDTQNSRVMKWTPGSTFGVVVAGGNGVGSNLNQLATPVGIYLDASKNLYVLESGNHRITKWAPGATSGVNVLDLVVTETAVSFTLDSNGNIYVGSGLGANVTRYAPGSSIGTVIAGGNGVGTGLNQIDAPSGIWIDNTNSVYISEQGNHRVVKWTPGASSGIVVAGGNGQGVDLDQLAAPSALWIADNGDLYVVEQQGNRVVKWLK